MVLKKHAAARWGNLIFLVPFILAYRPLIVRFKPFEVFLFTVGTAMILAVLVMGNRQPYVILKGDRLILNLHHYQEPEVHMLGGIRLVEQLSPHSCRIHSRDFQPVRLYLSAGDLKALLSELSDRNIRMKFYYEP